MWPQESFFRETDFNPKRNKLHFCPGHLLGQGVNPRCDCLGAIQHRGGGNQIVAGVGESGEECIGIPGKFHINVVPDEGFPAGS